MCLQARPPSRGRQSARAAALAQGSGEDHASEPAARSHPVVSRSVERGTAGTDAGGGRSRFDGSPSPDHVAPDRKPEDPAPPRHRLAVVARDRAARTSRNSPQHRLSAFAAPAAGGNLAAPAQALELRRPLNSAGPRTPTALGPLNTPRLGRPWNVEGPADQSPWRAKDAGTPKIGIVCGDHRSPPAQWPQTSRRRQASAVPIIVERPRRELK